MHIKFHKFMREKTQNKTLKLDISKRGFLLY